MWGKRGLAALVAALVLLSAAGPAMALNFTDGQAPNPMIEADTTVDEYAVSWGDDLQYEDDSGDVRSLPATLNSSEDHGDLGTGTVNAFTYTVTDIEFDDAGAFPHDSNDSALDASEWTTTGASMTNSTTAPGVEAVNFVASASGDSATYSTSITSDAEKRYVQAFYDVNSASAGQVTMTISDATDGDTATVLLYDADGNASNADTGATTTGEGKAIQVQVGKLDATGGDNVIDEIGSVKISADGAADVDLSAINLDRTSEYQLGQKYADDDNDDELETETITDATGPISVYSITTLGETFSDATIHGLTFPAQFSASELAEDDRSATFAEDNAYPQWAVIADIYYRINLPSAYDLSYSNVELTQTTEWPGTRYATVELKEGAGDTDFKDIDSWTDVTGSFDAENKSVTLDSTVSVGTEYAVHYQLKLTDDEANLMQQSMGGGGGPMGGGSGGILGFITSLPGIIVTGVAAFIGGRSLGVF